MTEADGADSPGPPPESLWWRLRAQPDRAPETIALAAAERFAAPAARWAALTLHHHSPAEAASIALRKHVWLARVEGGVTGVGGVFTSTIDLAGLAWIQSRMVFFIAAAYGFDPRHPMRPAELLALYDVYPTPAEARAALDGMGRHFALQYLDAKRSGGDERLAAELVKLVGRHVARRAALRLVPILSAPVSAVQNAAAAEALGRRAIEYYGGAPAG